MQTLSKTVTIVGFIALALLLGAGAGIWAGRNHAAPPVDTTQPPVTAVQTTSNKPALAKASANTPAPKKTPVTPAQTTDPAGETPAIATWEQKLDDILVADSSDATKVAQILTIIPTVGPEAQVQLSHHLVNLVQDDNYAMTGDLLTNPSTSTNVSSILMNDLLNRGTELKLTMLLAVARNDDHPLKGDAKELLELFIQEDKGADWNAWEASVVKYIKDNQPTPPPKD